RAFARRLPRARGDAVARRYLAECFLTRKGSVQLTLLRHLRVPRQWRDERGVVLDGVVIVVWGFVWMGLTSLFSGYTNLLTSTNLKIATKARNTAEAGINEAIYRLSRQEGQPGAITPDLSNPNWQVQILPTGTPSSTQVASIQNASDWG